MAVAPRQADVMIRAGDLCNRRVVTAAPGDAITTAVEAMRREHVGDVVVVSAGTAGPQPVGILTDRDVVVELLAPGVATERVTVGDCMSESTVTAREDEDLLVALRRMAQAGVRRLPIVNGAGNLCGILSVDDVLGFIGQASAAVGEIIAEGRAKESARRR
jgi:CBS domain-containing protein